MTYRVEYTRRARRGLSDDLPESVAAACVEFIGSALAESPHRVGKPLRATPGRRRGGPRRRRALVDGELDRAVEWGRFLAGRLAEAPCRT